MSTDIEGGRLTSSSEAACAGEPSQDTLVPERDGAPHVELPEIARPRARPEFCEGPLMSQPRRIRPGVTWFITRRTTRRHMLFRPDKDKTVQKVYWYVTAVLAEKFGIELHAVQVLSTHLHEVLTDVRGVLPAFLRERNRILANVLKRHRDWPEEVFQRSPASCVELFGPAAILKQIGYTLANCVEAGLVKNPENWPGVTVGAHEIGTRVVEVERPSMYFNPKKEALWPVRGTIALTMPKALAEAYGARASQVLRGVVHTAVERARRLAGRAGYVVGKVAQLYEVPFTRRSERPEPVGRRNPTFHRGRPQAHQAGGRGYACIPHALPTSARRVEAGDREGCVPRGRLALVPRARAGFNAADRVNARRITQCQSHRGARASAGFLASDRHRGPRSILHDRSDLTEQLHAPVLVRNPRARGLVVGEVPGACVGGDPDLARRPLGIDDALPAALEGQRQDVASALAIDLVRIEITQGSLDAAQRDIGELLVNSFIHGRTIACSLAIVSSQSRGGHATRD